MRISQNLPQFKHQSTLILVIGREEARLFLALDGNLTELEHRRIRHHRYSDKEGATLEQSRMEKEITDEFYREIKLRLTDLIRQHKPKTMLLFAPEEMRRRLKSMVSALSPNLELGTFIGNYVQAHPFKLLEEIKDRENRRSEKRKIVPPAAAKLLKRKS